MDPDHPDPWFIEDFPIETCKGKGLLTGLAAASGCDDPMISDDPGRMSRWQLGYLQGKPVANPLQCALHNVCVQPDLRWESPESMCLMYQTGQNHQPVRIGWRRNMQDKLLIWCQNWVSFRLSLFTISVMLESCFLGRIIHSKMTHSDEIFPPQKRNGMLSYFLMK